MAGLKMSMKLSQSLRMTPQLQQAIKMLQLSRMELENEIRKELIENPVLEEQMDTVEDDPAFKESQIKESEGDGGNISENVIDDKKQNESDPRKEDSDDWENYLDSGFNSTQQGSAASEEAVNYDNFISKEKSLRDHLDWQMSMSGFIEEEEVLMQILINYVEDDGYIKTPLEQIAESENIQVEDLEEMIPFLHEFDPAGVGARDLKECLLIQAKHIEEDTHDLVYVINNHLKDLEKKNYRGIAKEMNLDLDVVIEISRIILSMDPKPGRLHSNQSTVYVTPDVYVYKVQDDYVISLNEEGIPKLRISNLYKSLIEKEAAEKKKEEVAAMMTASKEEKGYIKDKLKAAMWLIKSIDQRHKTIYKVTDSIVKQQRDFLDFGPSHIKPMILRDVANDIGMHESTVSRVTSNKYVHTPQGIFELKYFFNSGISKTDGNSLASESVKIKIKKFFQEEDLKKPLSDQKIVELLKLEGIKIARRTVAKYRDALKILPSSKRKKFF